jgi:hypothetical protein
MTKKVPAALARIYSQHIFILHLGFSLSRYYCCATCNTKGLSVNILFPKVQDNHGSEPHDADQDAFVFGPSIR